MADEEKKVIYKVVIDEKAAESEVKSLTVTIDSLTDANKKLREERKKVDLQSAEGQKRVKEINAELDKNNKLIKDNVSALEKQRLTIGDYKNAIVDASKQVNVHGVSISGLTGKMAGLTGPQGVATIGVGIIGALGAAYAKSAAGARDLASANYQVSTAAGLVNNELAKMFGADGKGGGLISSLATYFNAFAFGPAVAVIAKMASDANNNLQELEVLQFGVNAQAKDALRMAEELRRIRDDSTKSYAERLDAANRVQGFINEREVALVGFQEKRLEQAKILLSLNKDDLEVQKLVKSIEFEIADKREEASGQHTEALRGILALETEIGKIQKANSDADRRGKSGSGTNDPATINDYGSRGGDPQTKIDTEKNFAAISLGITKDVNAGKLESEKFFNTEYQDILNERAATEMAFNQFKISSLQNLAAALTTAFGKNKVLALGALALEKGAAIGQVVANTGIANAKAIGFSPLTFGQPWVAINSIAAGLNIASILSAFTKATSEVSAAAGGGDFLTRGPTMLLVGDNPGGVERVTVEPLSGKGQTKVRGNNMIAMAGGGTLTTQPAAPFQTSSISNQLNSERIMNRMIDQIARIPRTAVVIEQVNLLNEQIAEIKQAATMK